MAGSQLHQAAVSISIKTKGLLVRQHEGTHRHNSQTPDINIDLFILIFSSQAFIHFIQLT